MAWHDEVGLGMEKSVRKEACQMHANGLERKLRHDLAVMGYQLLKSRASCWSVDNQLGFMIIDRKINAVIAGDRYDLPLDDVREFIAE